jgi:hypothetical protein
MAQNEELLKKGWSAESIQGRFGTFNFGSSSMFKKIMFGALASAIVLSTPASAAVNFDSTTGTGFVGKGDVQLAFGWNNQTLQRNAAGVTFTYNNTSTYDAVCTFTTGEGTRGEQTHNITHHTSVGVNASISYAPRKNSSGLNGDITGFFLTGFNGTPTGSGDEVPVVGGPCPGNQGTDGEWTSVTQTGGGDGGLYVNYGGVSVALPNTPVIVI